MNLTKDQKYHNKHRVKRLANLKENRAYYAEYAKNYQQTARKAILEILGDKCSQCGFNDLRALQIDHISGGGSKDRRNGKGSYYHRMLKDLETQPNKYQILCANCNWIKRSLNGEVRR